MVTINKIEPKLISVTVFDGISCHYPWFIVKITDGITLKDDMSVIGIKQDNTTLKLF